MSTPSTVAACADAVRGLTVLSPRAGRLAAEEVGGATIGPRRHRRRQERGGRAQSLPTGKGPTAERVAFEFEHKAYGSRNPGRKHHKGRGRSSNAFRGNARAPLAAHEGPGSVAGG